MNATSSRRKRKCPYCQGSFVKLPAHILKLHKTEPIGKALADSPRKSERRGLILAELTAESLRVEKHASLDENYCRTARGVASITSSVSCSVCGVVLKKSSFSKHKLRCSTDKTPIMIPNRPTLANN